MSDALQSRNFFHDELGLSLKRGKYGFMNKKGKTVIKRRFTYAEDFSEGLALVGVANARQGYIDTKGLIVIPPVFDGAQSFSEKLAGVKIDPRLVADDGSISASAVEEALKYDPHASTIKTEPAATTGEPEAEAAKEGEAGKDGAAKDSAAKDGAAKDSAAKDGEAVKDSEAKDGSAKETDVKKDAEVKKDAATKPAAEVKPSPAKADAKADAKPETKQEPKAEPKAGKKGKGKGEPGTKVATAKEPDKGDNASALKSLDEPAAGGKAEKSSEVAALVGKGKQKLDDGDPDAAAASFERAAALDPKNAEAVGGLGEASFEQGSFEAAARHLSRAAKLSRRASYRELLAQAQFKLGRYKDAAETCRGLLKDNPGSAKAKQLLDLAEKKLGSE